ncbi:MAG: UDP-N-acetylglucosamine 1-carboxyvinyltransferase [Lachnospiraceae bacterium]|nr:UDP-N-acetylglucosamine 1-carboxyvinyltransferase [Lachnospiraceae bacterium]
MDSIHIFGGERLCGQTNIQGSKNAALPILAATLLVPGISVIENCPDIADVASMIKLLQSVGCLVMREEHTVIVDASCIKENRLPAEHVTKMRSSIMLMGAMLGRTKEIVIDYPGGCVIGERPIDMHLEALAHMGILFEKEEHKLRAHADRIKGTVLSLPFASVGATENVILAAVLAEGDTILYNAAKEPEIIALCEFLKSAGAKIMGIGTDTLHIIGVCRLHEGYCVVPSDRIVAGTYMFACAGCGGNIELDNVRTDQLHAVYDCLTQVGAVIEYSDNTIFMKMQERPKPVPYVRTAVYPGFPTDLQSPFMTVLAVADGTSVIEEAIFENRFRIVKELVAMGADIQAKGQYAYICGKVCLYGRHVVAEELRGGAALVLAGLIAQGVTVVGNRKFIDRGYEDICQDLKNLGARISVR